MALLTSQRNTPMLADRDYFVYPVEANTNIYLGGMVAIDANGYLVPAQPFGSGNLARLNVLGRSERLHGGFPGENALNGSGAAGAMSVWVRRGVFRYDNDNSVTQAYIDQPCFCVDDHTVSANDGSGATAVPNTTEITFPAAAPLIVVLAGENIVPGSVKVTSASGGTGTVYVEGTDYAVDYQAGLIVALAGGGIAASSNKYIAYKYGPATRPVAGRIAQIDSSGVWVDFFERSVMVPGTPAMP